MDPYETERMQIDLNSFDHDKIIERSHWIAEPDIAELDATYRQMATAAYRLDLLDLLEPEQQLLRRQNLGPAPEAVTLHLPDDLAQPLALRPLREQHLLQHAGIVGKCFGDDRHGMIESRPAVGGDAILTDLARSFRQFA